jgi:hypothetical protein
VKTVSPKLPDRMLQLLDEESRTCRAAEFSLMRIRARLLNG